ncbi:DNA-binding response OmpR family regulator [Hydrogenoanaerobacterium saccharovorans]|uniref:Heme response regulator HssR n=1 Tax=Hydrogenoanaerobacterium saccharovorans TaxID=474960 RepID=A0A1H8BAB3_9FIRM|nr:response regulator transcription factor [Hydrogenoanaerobacterium saccharovorans]RPF47509.1 DNA-binding response OmpR family regulator [Hydrogenoanaerobacterium saccharovorans]SEM79752.1 DNA-binding response regulator, OmpR family, contains REC and winged-helix (wHTH) domain [Hydrogenoanaerobacterium saccharovorans]
MFHILVVEDEKNLRKLMSTCLEHAGYRVFGCENGLRALEVLDCQHIDLMICDIMMPEMDGYELTQGLRQANYELPILMVTAKETFEDKKKGFELGTDDYMVKPVDMNEMLLRVSALLRRAKIVSEHRMVIGKVTLDCNTLTVTTPSDTIELPKKEFYLLYKLLSYPQQIFTRQQLMDEIWGLDTASDERTVDVHIKRLREKFDCLDEFDIVTVRGLGYKAVKNV